MASRQAAPIRRCSLLPEVWNEIFLLLCESAGPRTQAWLVTSAKQRLSLELREPREGLMIMCFTFRRAAACGAVEPVTT